MDIFPCEEIAVSSDVEDPSVNCAVWNPKTGNAITRFKGPNCGKKCLAAVGDDYVISASAGKPILHVWTWSKTDRTEIKIVLPGVASVLTVSPCSNYCTIAISKKIYIWHISTGNLCNIVEHHTCDISALKFTEDGRYLVSAGTNDFRVFVWNFHRIVSTDFQRRDRLPLRNFADHREPITDVYVTSLGCVPKLVTCGEDSCCFVYELLSGKRLFTFFGDEPFTSVTMDPAEFHLYLGTQVGEILQVKFHEFLNDGSAQTTDERAVKKWKSEPSGSITCLSTSLDGRFLASGSSNGKARVWDTFYGKSDVNYTHKGAVSNIFFRIAPASLLSTEKCEPSMVFSQLKRCISTEDDVGELLPTRLSSENPLSFGLDPCEKLMSSMCSQGFCLDSARSKAKLEEELTKHKIVNEQFYSFTLGTYLNSIKGDLSQS